MIHKIEAVFAQFARDRGYLVQLLRIPGTSRPLPATDPEHSSRSRAACKVSRVENGPAGHPLGIFERHRCGLYIPCREDRAGPRPCSSSPSGWRSLRWTPYAYLGVTVGREGRRIAQPEWQLATRGGDGASQSCRGSSTVTCQQRSSAAFAVPHLA